MDYILGCNWEKDLIDVAQKYGVTELFGKLQADVVGGGRASFMSRRIQWPIAADYIRKVQDAGITFNYLLNGTCMGNRELTRRGQNELDSLIDRLADAGIHRFTVSLPYIASKIRRRIPEAQIIVSMMAKVESVEQARYWEQIGATTLILFDNKDFSFIQALKKCTGLCLEITANLSCLNRCHQMLHHINSVSHSSSTHGYGLYTLPMCETRCNYLKVLEPRRIIAGQWIRPQDVDRFENAGIDRLKILDRTSSTAQLELTLKAYTDKRFNGNLAELIPGYKQERMTGYLNQTMKLRMIRAFFKPLKFNLFNARPFAKRSAPPSFFINADKLDGYLDGFEKSDCRHSSCETCGWCDSFAKKAITFDEAERNRFLNDSEKNIEMLETGEFFRY